MNPTTTNPPPAPSLSPPQDLLPKARLEVPRRKRPGRRGLPWKLLLAAAVLAGAGYGGYRWLGPRGEQVKEITTAVVRADLPIIVTERGEMESSNSVDVRCEVEGRQNKIVWILPESTPVTKGQEVVKFDTDELTRLVADQEVKWKQADGKARAAKEELEVQKNKGASDIAKAELEWTLAKLDLRKYVEGEYKVDYNKRKGEIALAKRDLDEAKQKLEETKSLMKKGFATLENVRIQEGFVLNKEFVLSGHEANLMVLEKFERERKEVEFKAKAEEAERNLGRTKSSTKATVAKTESDLEAAEVTAKLEKSSLERIRKQLDKCVAHAPQDGILVYPRERYWDSSMRVQVGGMMHFQQTLFTLPDLNNLQIKVKIHESQIKKVAKGQKCEIRPEAFPNTVLRGTVEKVATLADNERNWDERSVKEYVTIVKVDEVPSALGLKPGMNAEVRIHINTLADVLLVPVQAVSEKDGKNYSYVQGPGGVEKREVVIGDNNDKFVAVKEGLAEGDQVTLDARSRLAAEAKAGEEKPGPAPNPDDKNGAKPKTVASTR